MKNLFRVLALVLLSTLSFAQGSGNAISDRSWVLIPASDLANVTSDFSVEAWISPAASDMLADGSSAIVSNKYHHSENFDGGFALVIDKQKLRFTIRDRYGNEYNLDSDANALVVNNWQHVAASFRYDDGTGNRFMYLFINGVTVNSRQVTTQERLNRDSKTHIGNSTVVEGYIFNGKIDEVRIWSLALMADDVRANMCRKLTSLSSNLKGYWRFDETSGTIVTDETSTPNNGTLYKNDLISADGRITSGAPIGDESTYNYSSPSSVALTHANGDYASVSIITGSPYGVQIYRVDEAPNVIAAPGNLTNLFTTRYWGVFIVEGTSPTYTFTYYYNGNPDLGSYENYQDLATRATNGSTSWTEANAILNTTTKTLTLTGQTGTEYIDGREVSPTPVEITSFGGISTEDGVVLSWQTATEVNNFGFNVELRIENGEWQERGFVQGHGTTNSPKNYEFTDTLDLTLNPNLNRIDYRLKQIDNDGTFAYSKIVTIDLSTITDVDDELNYRFALEQNYPNPFNPSTTIKFTVPSVNASRAKNSVSTTLKVYDILGREVVTLVNQKLQPGNHAVEFDASSVSSGVYFYRIQTSSGFVLTKKLMLLK